MPREGTRGASARKKSPKKAQLDEEAKAGNNSSRNNDSKQSINSDDPTMHPLARREGMNRRSLLTGLYGPRGERIRHVVANGALQLPTEVLDLIATIADELSQGSNNNDDDNDNQQQKQQPQSTKKKRKSIMQLPGLDSVVRPTMDKTLQKVIVTDIFHKQFPNPTDPSLPPIMRTVAANRMLNLVKAGSEGDAGAERIRGGGGDEVANEDNLGKATEINAENSSGEAGNNAPNEPPNASNDADAAGAPENASNAPASEASELPLPPTTTAEATETSTTTQAQPTEATPSHTTTASASPDASTTRAASEAAPDQAPSQETKATSSEADAGPSAPAPPQISEPTQPPTPATESQVAANPNPVTAATPTLAESSVVPAVAESEPSTSAVQSSATTLTTPPATATTSTAAPTPNKPVSSQAIARRASALAPAEAATSKVIPLTKKPEPTWEQHVPPSNDENLTDPQAKGRKPDWYNPTMVSNLERALMPEWFDESASHRTEEAYLKARATMMHISDQLGNRFVTSTLARRSLPGDVGSLHRLHSFLTHYLWMNEEAMNDSCPTAPSLQQPPQLTPKVWSEKRRGELIEAVVEASQQQQQQQQPPVKKARTEESDPMDVDVAEQPQEDEDSSFVTIDWDMVAEKVGASPLECEREFLAMPMDEASLSAVVTTERPITPDTLASDQPPARATIARTPKDEMAQEELLRSLVEGTSSQVLKAVTEAALQATGFDLSAAQRAGRLGLVAGQAARAAQAHEETVSRLLSEVVDQRMQKLEVRMALMDDLEGMLEAERVALEIERRDLYTTRCRDWFGGS